jgi:putative ABC transport system ATP-binding protein
MQNIINIKNLTKTYSSGNIETHVLKGINFEVKPGEFVAIMGRSGAGKSTLLYQMSLLDHPTGGQIVLDGRNTEKMSQDERTTFRLMELGYVFQDYALMPELTAIENVMTPLLMQGTSKQHAAKVSEDALTKVGLGDKLYNLPSQLSGGQQQRVSIARAIAHGPKIIFADEPTANLDSESSRLIIDIFRDLNERAGQTIIMVTHEEEYSKLSKRIVTLSDGMITSDISR